MALKLECKLESDSLLPVGNLIVDRSIVGQKVILDEPSPSNVKAAQ
jgi:hypothetical protein